MKNIFKSILYTILIYLVVIGCSESKSDSTKTRRFTFAVPTETTVNSFEGDKLSAQVFEIKNNTFLIVDAPSNYNYSQVTTLLAKSNPAILNSLKNISPLERIYKMDQQKEYGATEGQLINRQKDTKRYVLTLEIVNDAKLRKEYISVHGIGKAWPEITNNMKQMGIKDMELYLNGYQAYLIMDTRKDFDMAKDGEKWSKLPRESEWQEYVAKFQKVNPLSKATEKWQTMLLK